MKRHGHERRVEKLRNEVQRAQLEAISKVRGLFKQAGEEGYNPDADATWKDCTVRTRAALALTQGTMAAERAKTAADAAPRLGVVVVPMQITDAKTWEARKEILAGTAPKVIEAQVVEDAGEPRD